MLMSPGGVGYVRFSVGAQSFLGKEAPNSYFLKGWFQGISVLKGLDVQFTHFALSVPTFLLFGCQRAFEVRLNEGISPCQGGVI